MRGFGATKDILVEINCECGDQAKQRLVDEGDPSAVVSVSIPEAPAAYAHSLPFVFADYNLHEELVTFVLAKVAQFLLYVVCDALRPVGEVLQLVGLVLQLVLHDFLDLRFRLRWSELVLEGGTHLEGLVSLSGGLFAYCHC